MRRWQGPEAKTAGPPALGAGAGRSAAQSPFFPPKFARIRGLTKVCLPRTPGQLIRVLADFVLRTPGSLRAGSGRVPVIGRPSKRDKPKRITQICGIEHLPERMGTSLQ